MANPTAPSVTTDFSDWQGNNPNSGGPIDGALLDSQFANHKVAIEQTQTALADIRRSDGALNNGIVTEDALATGLLEDLTASIIAQVQPYQQQAEGSAALAAQSVTEAADSAAAAAVSAGQAAASATVLSTAQGSALDQINDAINVASVMAAEVEAHAVDAANAANDATLDAAYAEDWALAAEAWADYLDGNNKIPANLLTVTGVTGDHWSARYWANYTAQKAAEVTSKIANMGGDLNAWEDFSNVWLGAYPSDPSQTPTSAPLAAGMLYFNTQSDTVKVYTGTAWANLDTVPVLSVNGQVGHVNLTAANISAAPATHTHAMADIVNLVSNLDAKFEKAGGALTGKLTTLTSGTAGAGFRLPHGAAPTTPADGDVWTTSAELYVRINGSTRKVLVDKAQTISSPWTFTTLTVTTLTVTTLNVSGAVNLTGASQRILGDFANSVYAQRTMFQNKAAGATSVGAIPGATSTYAGFAAFNSTDPNNSSIAALSVDSIGPAIVSASQGSGAKLPLRIVVDDEEKVRFDTGDFAAFKTGITLKADPVYGIGLQLGASALGRADIQFTDATQTAQWGALRMDAPNSWKFLDYTGSVQATLTGPGNLALNGNLTAKTQSNFAARYVGGPLNCYVQVTDPTQTVEWSSWNFDAVNKRVHHSLTFPGVLNNNFYYNEFGLSVNVWHNNATLGGRTKQVGATNYWGLYLDDPLGQTLGGVRADGGVTFPFVYSDFTTGNAANVYVAAGGFFYRSVSGRKYKRDIKDLDLQEAKKVLNLSPVVYKSKSELDGDKQFWGLIAEDVAPCVEEMVVRNEAGEPDGVQYDRAVPALIRLVKDLYREIELLKSGRG